MEDLAQLHELSPHDFEMLVARLFESFGYLTEQTPGSWDGGIDCVVTDPRALVGGRIFVQAKRFSGTVDVAVVRDLYGLVLSQGVSKGVVVTTGTFGPTSRTFAKGKPLELIDGAKLKELLADAVTRGFPLVFTSTTPGEYEQEMEDRRNEIRASLGLQASAPEAVGDNGLSR